MEKIKNGLLGDINEQVSMNDYLVGSIELPKLVQQDKIYFQYNQGNTNHCTIYASMTAISNTTNYQFTESDIKEIIDLSVKAGKPINDGWYLYKAIDLVRNRYNKKFPNNQIITFQVNTLSKEYMEAINKGYFVATTFRYNQSFFDDYRNDGIVDGKDFDNTTGGHAVCTGWMDGISVIDNYYPKKTNIYKLKYYKDLVDNYVFSKQGYIVTLANKLPVTKEQLWMETQGELIVKLCSQAYMKSTNDIDKTKRHSIANYTRQTLGIK